MRLINTATGETIAQGAILHMTAGPNLGQAWRYEHVRPHTDGGHRVHVTRSHPKMGRVHREFHASLFGATVKVDVVWYRAAGQTAKKVGAKVDDWIMAGIFALVPLAIFESLHLAEPIAHALGFSSGH